MKPWQTQPPAPEGLTDALTTSYPGGEHILPHLDEGPYELIVVTQQQNPNWMAENALIAYPGASVWFGDEYADTGYDRVTIHPMPKFAARLVTWHESEYELCIDHQTYAGTYETLPGAEDILADYPSGLYPDTPEAAGGSPLDRPLRSTARAHLGDAITAAVAAVGADAVLRVLSVLDVTDVDFPPVTNEQVRAVTGDRLPDALTPRAIRLLEGLATRPDDLPTDVAAALTGETPAT